MNSLLYYLLQVIAASGILYGYYYLFLRNKKFHQYNRFYLLAASLISILIPFLNIPVYFTHSETESSFIFQTLTVISSPEFEEGAAPIINMTEARLSWFTRQNILYTCYILIAIIVSLRMLFSILKIRTIIRKNPVEEIGNIHFINTHEPGTPFSFFRWLFWNREIELQSGKGEQIFRHEVFHIQQKHSWDIIFLELLTIIFWLNPFFHLIKKELKAIHEFLADKFAISKNNKWEYAELLLMQVLNTKQKLVNPFFHNQIKRRIAMITTSKKPGYLYLRKLMVLPVAAIVIALFAFSYKKKETNNAVLDSETPVTIVIDAGHGGTDPGAMSTDNKYSEAQITLKIAQQIQNLAKEYNVKVVMTREDDKFPGNASNKEDGLRKRVEIANEIKPDAFIAIHVNAGDKGMQNSNSGFEAYVAVKKEDGRLLASAILENLSLIYTTTSELKQSKERGVYVLDHNKYPSVLLQCGYINNPKDLAFITNKANHETIARSILEAIVKYRNSEAKLNESILTEATDTAKPKTNSTVLNGTVKIEGLEDSKIEAAEFRTSNRFMGTGDTATPLIVIDGIKQPKNNNSRLENIDPATIDSIQVLKGETAIAKYSNEGKNGVIEIFTDKNKPKIKEVTLEERKLNDDNNKVFEKVEIEPSFPGGDGAWGKYFEKNLNASVAAKNHAPAGNYTVYIQFIVHKDGSISDIKPLTNHGFGIEEEVIRVIKKGPKWSPAIQNGRAVNAYKRQPVTFVVTKDKNQAVTVIEKRFPEVNKARNSQAKLNKSILTEAADTAVSKIKENQQQAESLIKQEEERLKAFINTSHNDAL